jgi:hypothetical protein
MFRALWQVPKTGASFVGGDPSRLDELPQERRGRVHVGRRRLDHGSDPQRVRQRLQHPRTLLPHRRQRRQLAEHEGIQDGSLRFQDRNCRCKFFCYFLSIPF